MDAPSEPPPSYSAATSSTARQPSPTLVHDERPLPRGWVTRTHKQSGRQYYVDTTVDPPRSIWHHPLDDEEYLDSLAPTDSNEAEFAHERYDHKRQMGRSPAVPRDPEFAREQYDHERQMAYSSIPDELPPRNTAQNEPSSGASGWATRFGNNLQDNFRHRYGMNARQGGPNDMNGAPAMMVMGRGGRRARPVYIDNETGYGYVGRRRRGGLISAAINASMSDRR